MFTPFVAWVFLLTNVSPVHKHKTTCSKASGFVPLMLPKKQKVVEISETEIAKHGAKLVG